MKNGGKNKSVAFIILFSLIIYIYIYIYVCILGVARYRDVTVRYLPRFGGKKTPQKTSTMLGFFSFILNRH